MSYTVVWYKGPAEVARASFTTEIQAKDHARDAFDARQAEHGVTRVAVEDADGNAISIRGRLSST